MPLRGALARSSSAARRRSTEGGSTPRFLGAAVLDEGLMAACQYELEPVEGGRFEISVFAAAEQTGCGGSGARIVLWTFANEAQVYSVDAIPWPGDGAEARVSIEFVTAEERGAVPLVSRSWRRRPRRGGQLRRAGHPGRGPRRRHGLRTTSTRRTGSLVGTRSWSSVRLRCQPAGRAPRGVPGRRPTRRADGPPPTRRAPVGLRPHASLTHRPDRRHTGPVGGYAVIELRRCWDSSHGVSNAFPQALLDAGLADAIGARRAGRVTPPPYDPRLDPTTGPAQPGGATRLRCSTSPATGDVLDAARSRSCSAATARSCSATCWRCRRGRYGLLFIDGHADFYQPEAEPNGEAASMDLALATGRGPAVVADLEGRRPLVRDEDVVVFGRRDAAEAAEAAGSQRIEDTAIAVIDLPLVRAAGIERRADAVARLVRPSSTASGSTSTATPSTTPSCRPSTTAYRAGSSGTSWRRCCESPPRAVAPSASRSPSSTRGSTATVRSHARSSPCSLAALVEVRDRAPPT